VFHFLCIVISLQKLLAQFPELEDQKVAELVVSKLVSKEIHSALYYRIKGARQVGGAKAQNENQAYIKDLLKVRKF